MYWFGVNYSDPRPQALGRVLLESSPILESFYPDRIIVYYRRRTLDVADSYIIMLMMIGCVISVRMRGSVRIIFFGWLKVAYFM